jgi:hypothetical protein
MSSRLARVALALYPFAFRRRYGAEMLALIEDSGTGPVAVVDLLRGAFLAHLRPAAGLSASIAPGERLRASASGVLACWIAFAAAGFGFYKTTEDHPFSRAGDSHPALGGAHVAVQVLAVLASIAVLAGALPLVLTALRQASRTRAVRGAAGLALAGVALFGISSGALVLFAHSTRSLSDPAAGAAFAAWAMVGLLGGGACAIAARRGLFAIRVHRRGLLAALACGTVVTAAMALMALATAIYFAALGVEASGLAAAGNGPFGVPSVGISIAFQMAVMLAATTLAAVSTRRGWAAVASSRAA